MKFIAVLLPLLTVNLAQAHNWFKDAETETITHAVVTLAGNSTVKGVLHFYQSSGDDDVVNITGTITGLDPNSLRGIHVHESGDLSGGCASTLTHFNPFNKTHGGPDDEVRHVGDLGNIESDETGTAVIDIQDWEVSLRGKTRNIIGRGFVVHAATDDLGRGGNETSRTVGNAGARSACGVIGLAP